MKTPVNLITGFLGVGKTTAILDLLARRPAGSRWAVLVNEFGQVGIDGATLAQSGVAVREVPGGCVCCAAQVPLRVALTKLLREVRPERLLIEPTGLGHPAGVIDALREPGLANALELRNVICLVDARQLGDERYRSLETYQDQINLADILLANKCDVSSAEALLAFDEFAADCYPPKRLVAKVSQGRVDPAWLDVRTAGDLSPSAVGHAHDLSGFTTRGWLFPPDQIFELAKLKALFEAWCTDRCIIRAKGVFRIGKDSRLIDLAAGAVSLRPVAHRSDSRVDIIADAIQCPDWTEMETLLHAARLL